MRYKTITVHVSPRSNNSTQSCSTLSGETWDSLEEALNKLACDGWEIDHVIHKTIVCHHDQEYLLLNQPVLIMKNNILN
jgi:hypothetical protein